MSDLIRFDSNGKVYIECSICNRRALPVNGLCNKHLYEYNTGKIKIDCPAVKKMHERNQDDKTHKNNKT